MKLPVPKFLAVHEANIQLASGTDENGSLNIVSDFTVRCRFQEGNTVAYTNEGDKIHLKGKAFILEGFCNFTEDSTQGFCIVNGIKYDIKHISKKYNPDGSINHIVLELM